MTAPPPEGPGRYAPSPSGPLHLGNLRTALIAWLAARSRGAGFLMRVEDLDPGRSRAEWFERQLADLRAIGVDWDGPPAFQSDRLDLYREALTGLERQGLLYECYCTRAEIREAASAPHPETAEAAYPGTCRNLSEAERERRRKEGRPPALRVRAGPTRIGFDDAVHGRVESVVDDFVVRRNDGAFAYNLAVIVDDCEQGVAEVVRGDDLLDSTGRQLWLAERLALRAPTSYAHVPLMLGPDGARLAKRHGSITLGQRLSEGASAEDVRDELLASIGLNESGKRSDPAALIETFRFADLDKCDRTHTL